MTDAPSFSIVTPAADGTISPVGTITTDSRGYRYATVQMPSEWPWEMLLQAGPCDVTCDGFVNGKDWDVYMDWFVAGDRRADFDRDFFVTGLDVEAYTDAFISGGF